MGLWRWLRGLFWGAPIESTHGELRLAPRGKGAVVLRVCELRPEDDGSRRLVLEAAFHGGTRVGGRPLGPDDARALAALLQRAADA